MSQLDKELRLTRQQLAELKRYNAHGGARGLTSGFSTSMLTPRATPAPSLASSPAAASSPLQSRGVSAINATQGVAQAWLLKPAAPTPVAMELLAACQESAARIDQEFAWLG